MRVTNSFSQQDYLNNLSRVQSELNAALERMSTQLRVERGSDDPVAATELGELADETKMLTMRKNGISQSQPWLELTEQGISDLNSVLIKAQTYAEQGASSTLNASQRQALAEQIRGLRDQVKSIVNLRVNGQYIFSGTRTDLAPYGAAGTYQGNESVISIPLDQNTAPINIPGDQIFGDGTTTGPLKLLSDLETALRTGTADDVQALLDPLRTAQQNNSVMIAKIGNMRSAIEDANTRINNRQTTVAARANALGAADLATAISDVAKFTQAHQATLSAGARIFGATFFDYMG